MQVHPADKTLYKPQFVCRTDHYSAIGKNKIVTHAATWMDLQGVTLGRRCQPRKILCCVTVFMKHPQNDNRGEEQQTESSNGHAGLSGHESLACKDKAVLHFDCGSGCRNLFSVITMHWMVYTERYVRSEKHHVLALHYYYMSIGARKQGMGLSKLF